MRIPAIWFVAILGFVSQVRPQGLDERIDDWLDHRFAEDRDHRLDALLGFIAEESISLSGLEAALRRPRASYPELKLPKKAISTSVPLICDHVDLETVYHLYVPSAYDHSRPSSLVIVGHGGNSAMSSERAARVARDYLAFWTDAAEKHGAIAAAPATTRGWGAYGNSILFSLISKLSRQFNIHPDRIYVTGQSMGGHLSYRTGIMFPDRFGAIGPQSGGYDYVENGQIFQLFNIPGYATFGKEEPYGIDVFNRRMRDWLAERGYPWKIVEKEGGHAIYRDEIDRQFEFFAANPRNLYRDRIEIRTGGGMRHDRKQEFNPRWDRDHTWRSNRPIVFETVHWARVFPSGDPAAVQRASIRRLGPSKIAILSRDVPRLRLYLHPSQFDLSKPIHVDVNGSTREIQPETGARLMLELVRDYDDRGRIFHGRIELAGLGSGEVPEPAYRDR